MSLADKMLQALKDMEKPSLPLTHTHSPHWMLNGSLRMVNTRADHCRQPDHNQNMARTLTKKEKKLLMVMVDTCRRAHVAAEEIGACLETLHGTPPDIQWAYSILKKW